MCFYLMTASYLISTATRTVLSVSEMPCSLIKSDYDTVLIYDLGTGVFNLWLRAKQNLSELLSCHAG
jgi:predicted regulator of Ras-like GTPase activity (Roadblock/LC7/MglB family)